MGNDKLSVNIPGVNAESGLGLCDGDMDIYVSSLRLYIKNIPVTLDKMVKVTAESLKNYTIDVHGVKGMSDYIGAIDTRDTAKRIEAMAKEGNLAGVLAQNDTFIKNTRNLVNEVKVWLSKYDASPA